MKKILLLLLLLLVGCVNLSNTPTKKVENFLKKYQTLDNDVLTDLNNVIDNDITLNSEQKAAYRNIMKKHYQNITYGIKDETIDGDDAIVKVQISVTDFRKVIDEANLYMNEQADEFKDENGNYDLSKFMDYQLSKMKETKDKVKYTLEIPLTKINKEWHIDELNDEIYDKLNGMYEY